MRQQAATVVCNSPDILHVSTFTENRLPRLRLSLRHMATTLTTASRYEKELHGVCIHSLYSEAHDINPFLWTVLKASVVCLGEQACKLLY